MRLLNRLYAQLAEKDRREGSEKVYDERMDMIMEVSADAIRKGIQFLLQTAGIVP